MGDRAGATVRPEQFTELDRLGVLARRSSAGLAGKPTPGPPPSIAPDGSYVVISPRGTIRRSYRTRTHELAGVEEKGASR
jgi:hypothetical protein